MDSQKIAGLLAAIIALIVFAVVFVYTPKRGADADTAKQQVGLPKAPVGAPVNNPPVRGPVIRDITPEK